MKDFTKKLQCLLENVPPSQLLTHTDAETLKSKGGVRDGRLILGNVEFQIGDGAQSKAALPAGTVRQ